MSWIDEVSDFLPHEIQVEPYSSQDEFGEPSFGTAVTYKGRVEMKNMMMRDEFGQERVASGRIFLNTKTVPSSKDRITLPTGYTPTNPDILAVYPKENTEGIDHVIVLFRS
jgi:hypothetical protein